MSTRKRGLSAYLRVNNPIKGVAPTNKRSIQDINQVFNSMVLICAKKRCIIYDASVQKGHCQEAAMGGIVNGEEERWGYARKLGKHDYKSQQWHCNAKEVLQIKLESAQKEVRIN
jgi:hypothetical protein